MAKIKKAQFGKAVAKIIRQGAKKAFPMKQAIGTPVENVTKKQWENTIKRAAKEIKLERQYKEVDNWLANKKAETAAERASRPKQRMGGKIKKACKGTLYPKSSSVSSRLKKGGSFPDLNKDGKITKADILKGRGVIAKKGMKVKKAQDGLKTVNPGYGASSAGLQITKKAQKRKADESKSKYEASTNPKVEYKTRLMKTPSGTFGGSKFSVDTTGLAAGKRRFPVKRTTRSGKDVYYETNRPGAKRSVRASQMKKGGMVKTKKCMYGCK